MVSERALIGSWAFVKLGTRPHFSASVAVDEPTDRRAHRVGAMFQVGARFARWVHRSEPASDEFRRQKTGIASRHVKEMESAATRPNSAWY
jgi:hypothetical protein